MLLNQVYQYTDSNERIRVVYETLEFIWLINLNDESAWPILMPTSELHELLAAQTIECISEPFTFSHVELDGAQVLKRDEAYTLLKILLKDHGKLFDKASRNRLIRNAVEVTGKPRIYFIRQLRRYWQRGMTPNALLPDYHKSGGKGKSRRSLVQYEMSLNESLISNIK